MGLAAGVVWATTLPNWMVQKPQQLQIRGLRLLGREDIRELVSLSYPQSILRLSPEAIAEKIETHPLIAEANVSRELFPPAIAIWVRERQPVAVAKIPQSTTAATAASVSQSVGLLDAEGRWFPLKGIAADAVELPELTTIGFPSVYRAHWQQVYQAIAAAPFTVREIHWQNPNNIILKTEMGTVHLGPYQKQFRQQLQQLERLRRLPKQIPEAQIAYIDLRNPNEPAVQLASGASTTP
jgi:cell division protein FtsQ